MIKIIYVLIGVALVAAGLSFWFISQPAVGLPVSDETVMCTMDAQQCPDGSYVGRTGPACEFVCPPTPDFMTTMTAAITAKSDLIKVTAPTIMNEISSPLLVTGEARGQWFFEGSFPVELTDWEGVVIASGVATAQSDWMTKQFVPFTATLTYDSPFVAGFRENGKLILKKDNPSGEPENDDELVIPVRFTPDGGIRDESVGVY